MQLSIVILNYKVRYFLELCLKSVQEAITDIDAEIIVIDNNSQDGSCEMVKALFPNITLIENTENVGFSKANNQAVAIATGEYVCILNPDTVVAEDTFTQLLLFAATKENLGIVGCKLIDGAGQFLPESKRNVPTPTIAMQKILGISNNYYANHIHENEIGEATVFVGAFMLLKRAVYLEVQGFDEAYFMYGEDIDLSYTIKQAGYNNYYYGNTTVIHFKGESTLKNELYASRFYGAMQLFYKKHFRKNVFFDCLVFIGTSVLPFFSRAVKPKVYTKEVLILDNNIQPFKDLISKMEAMSYQYKIIPKNSTFSILSNSSESRGVVEMFNDN